MNFHDFAGFVLIIFQKKKNASCLGAERIFERLSLKTIAFLTPKRLQNEQILSLLLALVALLLVRFAMCSLLAPFKNSL